MYPGESHCHHPMNSKPPSPPFPGWSSLWYAPCGRAFQIFQQAGRHNLSISISHTVFPVCARLSHKWNYWIWMNGQSFNITHYIQNMPMGHFSPCDSNYVTVRHCLCSIVLDAMGVGTNGIQLTLNVVSPVWIFKHGAPLMFWYFTLLVHLVIFSSSSPDSYTLLLGFCCVEPSSTGCAL